MEDFHCEMFELYFQFPREEVNEDAFLEAIRHLLADEYTDEEGNVDVAFSFGSREEEPKLHAHLRVRLRKEKKSRVELSYHRSSMEVEDVQPPYAEDCAQWLGVFFKTEEMDARINAAFTFDKSFSPVFVLPFPFTSPEKALAGALVTGMSLLLPNEDGSDTVIIQKADSDTFIFLNRKTKISLKIFDLSAEVERASTVVRPLVKEQGADDESGN